MYGILQYLIEKGVNFYRSMGQGAECLTKQKT